MKQLLCIVILLAARPVVAGEWHVGPSLLCQDCHLQHSSEEGLPLPGGPYSVLLLKNSVNELCLSCHDGSDPAAPDIQSPVQMYQSTPSGESAAGWFGLLGTENHAGHNIGVPTVTPLSTESALADLSCASCHAVHGNGNYRNLRHDPAGQGDSILLIDGADLFSQFKPSNPPTAAATVAAYVQSNIGYRQNYSTWCISCHDQVSTTVGGLAPAHFNGHPSDVALDAFSFESHTDPIHWVSGVGDGFIVAGSTENTGIPRVPFEVPQAVTYVAATTPHAGDEVVCISCHKPHGGQNEKSLRWPYYEGGARFLAGCQQCHNK